MPNWCWNHLEVSGDEIQLREFVEKSTINIEENNEFSFEGTLPRGDRKDWYEWSLENWGTKWDACEAHVDHNDIDYFAVTFDTAWGPPINWLKNIIKDFPDLQFALEYEEPGMAFGGKLSAHYNNFWNDDHWELEQASECCEAEVFYVDDERYSLKEEDIHTTYGTDYQCSKCKKETETISMNVANITPSNIRIYGTNEN